MHVLLVPKETTVVATAVAYDVGSKDEAKGRTGLAHLFEHMMFRGSTNFPDAKQNLASWGGVTNAFTSRDMTVYYEVTPKKYLSEVLAFEADRMRNLIINKELFDIERGAVVSERKLSYEDPPIGKLYWQLPLFALDQHNYRTGPIGHQKDLDAMTATDAQNFYRQFYAPNNATIIVVGSFKINEALTYIDKSFGEFKAEKIIRPTSPVEATRRTLRKKTIRGKSQHNIMVDAHQSPAILDKDAATEALTCQLFANSSVGYLRYQLVEKAIAQSVWGSCWPSREKFLSMFFLQAYPKVSTSKLEKAYLQARKTFPDWLDQKKLDRLRSYYLSGRWEQLRSNQGIAIDLATSIVSTNDYEYSFKLLEEMQKITIEDIKKRFAAWNKLPTRMFLIPEGR